MAKTEQYIPIFVGSTYLDLKEYREKVRETLMRMETFVHGMEQFGARSGAPVEECLAEVAKCKIYVGIFAMRYGTIPEGYDKSLTQLEYEEAQKLKLPSYIFLIDEENASITPSTIDFHNQIKLQDLKKCLIKRHTPDYFTSPDDLANKVGSAIHRALQDEKAGPVEIDQGIETVIPTETTIPGKSILRRFKVLPQRWQGVEFKIHITNYKINGALTPAFMELKSADELCGKFKLTISDSVTGKWYVDGCPDNPVTLVAEREIAYTLIDVDYFADFEVIVETLYYTPEPPDDDPCISAIKVKKIIDILPVTFSDDDDIPF